MGQGVTILRTSVAITKHLESLPHPDDQKSGTWQPIISIRKMPATNSIPPTPRIPGGKGGSLIPKFKGNDIKSRLQH
jgi:hypothetical protein